jgi:drug/metabolite transporter (DMT)-like permease
MMRFYCIGFLVLLAFDTMEQTCFKYVGVVAAPLEFSAAWLERVISCPWSYGALCGYLGSFATWMTLLRRAPIGPAFAASHLEIVTVTCLSVWIFHEPMTWHKILGGGLILLGVFCLAKAEQAVACKEAGTLDAQQA